MVFTSDSKRREINGRWVTTRRNGDRIYITAPRETDSSLSRSGAGDLSARRTARSHRRLGAWNEHGGGDHTLENSIHRADDRARRGTPLARAPSRPPIFATQGLSCQLSLAVNTVRLHA